MIWEQVNIVVEKRDETVPKGQHHPNLSHADENFYIQITVRCTRIVLNWRNITIYLPKIGKHTITAKEKLQTDNSNETQI